MKKIFADTSFLVAFYNKKDKDHSEAREVIRNKSILMSILNSSVLKYSGNITLRICAFCKTVLQTVLSAETICKIVLLKI